MAFAIFYSLADAQQYAAEFTRTTLANPDRAFATACWNAGLSQWATAPVDSRPSEQPTDARRIVISGNHQGKPITLAQFRDFLSRQAVSTGNRYLAKLVEDMGRPSGAVEPWV